MSDITDENSLFNNIISGAVKSGDDVVNNTQEPITQEPLRDETGKFAKADTPVEQPTTEKPTTQTQEPNSLEDKGNVPVAAVQDERRKRQEAERRAAELEQRLAALESKSNTPAQPTPKHEQPQPLTIWDDPDEYMRQMQTPIQQQMSELREMLMEQQAMARHTPEAVIAAKEAAMQLANKPEGVALYQEIMAKGGNHFDTLVDWHKRQQTLALVGPDPQAFLAAEREKLLADPAFLAQALERAKATATTSNNGRNSAPRVSLPSLSNIPASGGANANAEPQSDSELFASATARRK